jgi:hypothetical protein
MNMIKRTTKYALQFLGEEFVQDRLWFLTCL